MNSLSMRGGPQETERRMNSPVSKAVFGGKVIDFSKCNIIQVLQLTPMSVHGRCDYLHRLNREPEYDRVLIDLYVLGAEWRMDAQGEPSQLRRADLRSVAKGWVDFVQSSILPTSNRSEVNLERAILVHCIMKERNVDVADLIADAIDDMAQSTVRKAKLGYPSLIHKLCLATGAHIEGDLPLPVVRLITVAFMRGPTRSRTVAPQAAPSSSTPGQLDCIAEERSSDSQEVRLQRMEATLVRIERKNDYIINALRVLNPQLPPFVDEPWVPRRQDDEDEEEDEAVEDNCQDAEDST